MHVSELQHPVSPPLGDEVERLFGRPLEAGLLDVGVEEDRVDEPRAAIVRARGDGADDRLHAGLRLGRDDLPRLDVGREVDGERGQAVESLLVHAREDSGPCAVRAGRYGSSRSEAPLTRSREAGKELRMTVPVPARLHPRA